MMPGPLRAYRFIFPILAGLLLWAGCVDSDPQPNPPKEECKSLAELLDRIEALDSAMQGNGKWEDCQGFVEPALEGLATNAKNESEECNFLNQHHFPDRPRFLFVESLRDRIERDTITEGIRYLVRLRGIFSEDEEITEFFSEELAHVAMRNPACYLGYIHENPDQEVMLLFSTKWNYMDADTLIAKFGRLEDSEAVTKYLLDLKAKETGFRTAP